MPRLSLWKTTRLLYVWRIRICLCDIFFQTFWAHYSTRYVTCGRHIGQQLIKLSTSTKQPAKRRSIRKLIQGPGVQLPRKQQGRAWNITVSRNIIKEAKSLACNGEVVAWGGFQDPVVKLIMKRPKHIWFWMPKIQYKSSTSNQLSFSEIQIIILLYYLGCT